MSKGRRKSGVGRWKTGDGRRDTEVGKQKSGSRSHSSTLKASLVVIILLVFSCSSGGNAGGADVQARLDNKELKYFTNGKKLYTQHCSNCHMPNGEGLGQLIPPLKKSDYLLSDIGRAASIIVNGQQGPVIVNGVEYNQPMPANLKLNPTEVTEILTYISNAWGNEYGGVALETVKNALNQ